VPTGRARLSLPAAEAHGHLRSQVHAAHQRQVRTLGRSAGSAQGFRDNPRISRGTAPPFTPTGGALHLESYIHTIKAILPHAPAPGSSGRGRYRTNSAHHMCKMLCRVEGRYIYGTQGGAAHRRKGRYGCTSNIGMGTCPASFMETRVLGKRLARPFLPARPRRRVCPRPSSTVASMKR